MHAFIGGFSNAFFFPFNLQKSPEYLPFLEKLTRELYGNQTSDQIKKGSVSLNSLAGVKLEEEKAKVQAAKKNEQKKLCTSFFFLSFFLVGTNECLRMPSTLFYSGRWSVQEGQLEELYARVRRRS